jgi:hypothetical protein
MIPENQGSSSTDRRLAVLLTTFLPYLKGSLSRFGFYVLYRKDTKALAGPRRR